MTDFIEDRHDGSRYSCNLAISRLPRLAPSVRVSPALARPRETASVLPEQALSSPPRSQSRLLAGLYSRRDSGRAVRQEREHWVSGGPPGLRQADRGWSLPPPVSRLNQLKEQRHGDTRSFQAV